MSQVIEFCEPDRADVIVALGGDGFMLRTLHAYLLLDKPIYGMKCGTVGFLMNDFDPTGLEARIEAARKVTLCPLAMQADLRDGSRADAVAFNEVSVIRSSVQSANVRISVDGIERLANFVGDGLIVSTAAGSTAYNLSAHGPILPIGCGLHALTPVSPFRPRNWKGALLPHASEILIENLDPEKRPLGTSADFAEWTHTVRVRVRQEPSRRAILLFDSDHSLEERVIREQFLNS
jgi:NAD+ kinase